MPTYRKGDMWTVYEEADLFLITTSSAVSKDGTLVMGQGIALAANQRFSGLDKALGQQILKTCGSLGTYGLLISSRWPEAKLGAFQVKTDFNQSASLGLIQKSTTALCAWCKAHPQARVHLNFPGVGAGGLLREKVMPIVEQLPETVCIWEYPDSPPEPALEPPAPTPPAQPERKRPKWLPDPRDAEAMAQSAQAFFMTTVEDSMSQIEWEWHIFVCAFYRGARWMHQRITAEIQPLMAQWDEGQKGIWVQGEAVFLPGVEDSITACDQYRQQMAQARIAVETGGYTDGVRLRLLQKQQEAAGQKELPAQEKYTHE